MNFLALLKDDTYRFATVLAGAVFLNAVFLYFVLTPFFGAIVRARVDIQHAQGQIAVLDDERTRFLAIEKTVSKEGSLFDTINKTILDISVPLPFIELIEAIAKEQGVLTKLMVVDVPSDGMQKFQIVVFGDFPYVFQYLRVLEFLPYQASFKDFQFEFFENVQNSRIFSDDILGDPDFLAANASHKVLTKLTLDVFVRVK